MRRGFIGSCPGNEICARHAARPASVRTRGGARGGGVVGRTIGWSVEVRVSDFRTPSRSLLIMFIDSLPR